MWRIVLLWLAPVGHLVLGEAQLRADFPRTDPEGTPLPARAIARLGSTRFRHAGFIQPLVFALDGQTLFVGIGRRDALYAWDTATGRLRWQHRFEIANSGERIQ